MYAPGQNRDVQIRSGQVDKTPDDALEQLENHMSDRSHSSFSSARSAAGRQGFLVAHSDPSPGGSAAPPNFPSAFPSFPCIAPRGLPSIRAESRWLPARRRWVPPHVSIGSSARGLLTPDWPPTAQCAAQSGPEHRLTRSRAPQAAGIAVELALNAVLMVSSELDVGEPLYTDDKRQKQFLVENVEANGWARFSPLSPKDSRAITHQSKT
eukprot:scaffold2534_cov260-Pinguiococcus_pyrenoidosus.AAC.18